MVPHGCETVRGRARAFDRGRRRSQTQGPGVRVWPSCEGCIVALASPGRGWSTPCPPKYRSQWSAHDDDSPWQSPTRMADLIPDLLAEPRSLTEELYGRPQHLTVFISSKMRGGVYVVERARCAETVDRTGLVRAWYWERDANAGPYCSLELCLRRAASVDGLILILGDELTDTTRQEYEVARGRSIPTFVFIDQRETQNDDAKTFVESVRNHHSVTKNFGNIVELETHVLSALRDFNSRSWRTQVNATWASSRGKAA